MDWHDTARVASAYPFTPPNAAPVSSTAGVHVRVFVGAVSPGGPRVRRAGAVPDPGGPGRGGDAVRGVPAPSADPDFAGEERGGGVAGDGGFSVSLSLGCIYLFSLQVSFDVLVGSSVPECLSFVPGVWVGVRPSACGVKPHAVVLSLQFFTPFAFAEATCVGSGVCANGGLL